MAGISDEASLPHIDECRYLILKLTEQAIRDFLSLEHSNAPIEQVYFQTARFFLFHDEYTIDWGPEERTLEDLLDVIGLDIDWIRMRVLQLKQRRVREFEMRRLLDE
jgi:hypothetical protein